MHAVNADEFQSREQLVEQLAIIGRAVQIAVRSERMESRPDDIAPFVELPEERQAEVLRDVHAVLRSRDWPIADVWAQRLEYLREQGWKYGWSRDEELRTCPLIRPFKDLPLIERQAYSAFVAAIRSVYF